MKVMSEAVSSCCTLTSRGRCLVTGEGEGMLLPQITIHIPISMIALKNSMRRGKANWILVPN